MATEEDIIRLNLDQERRAQQAQLEAEQEEQEPELKRMGAFVFAIAFFLTLIQTSIEWITAGTVGWFIGAPISIVLWFILRPYRKSMGQARIFLNFALVLGMIPFLDMIPADNIAVVYAFIKSRSKIVQKLGDRMDHQLTKAAPALNVINMTQARKPSIPNIPLKASKNEKPQKLAA